MSVQTPAVRLVDDTVVRLYDWRGTGKFVELSGPRQNQHGAQLLEGLAGLWEAPITQVEIKTARLPGGIPVTVRIEKMRIEMATIIQGRDSVEWQIWNRRIRSLLSPTHDSPLVVQTLPWGVRWIGVRLAQTPDDPFDLDPTLTKTQIWNWELDAYDPDWRSKDLTAHWVNKAGTGVGNLRVAYRGDRRSFPKWTGNGGDWVLQAKPGGMCNPLPRMVAGEEWVADAHPLAFQLQSTRNRDKWELLQRGFTDWIEEEGEYTFGVKVDGPTSAACQLRLEQRHRNPWG
ncbi:minor tail protein [Gordonia phage Dogfish]|nr:minor tail protein [Gordonia phage Dogfish]